MAFIQCWGQRFVLQDCELSSHHILVLIETTSPHKPPVIVRSPTSSYAEEGEALVAACKVEGFPEPRVDFFKEGNLIKNNDTFTVGK